MKINVASQEKNKKEEKRRTQGVCNCDCTANLEPWAADTRMSSRQQNEADLLTTEQMQKVQAPQVHWAWILHYL